MFSPVVTSPATGGQVIRRKSCPPRATAFIGQESQQVGTAGGRVTAHLQTDLEDDQVLSGTSHSTASPELPLQTDCNSARQPRNTGLEGIQKAFLSWNRPHGREACEKLKKHLLNLTCETMGWFWLE